MQWNYRVHVTMYNHIMTTHCQKCSELWMHMLIITAVHRSYAHTWRMWHFLRHWESEWLTDVNASGAKLHQKNCYHCLHTENVQLGSHHQRWSHASLALHNHCGIDSQFTWWLQQRNTHTHTHACTSTSPSLSSCRISPQLCTDFRGSPHTSQFNCCRTTYFGYYSGTTLFRTSHFRGSSIVNVAGTIGGVPIQGNVLISGVSL